MFAVIVLPTYKRIVTIVALARTGVERNSRKPDRSGSRSVGSSVGGIDSHGDNSAAAIMSGAAPPKTATKFHGGSNGADISPHIRPLRSCCDMSDAANA